MLFHEKSNYIIQLSIQFIQVLFLNTAIILRYTGKGALGIFSIFITQNISHFTASSSTFSSETGFCFSSPLNWVGRGEDTVAVAWAGHTALIHTMAPTHSLTVAFPRVPTCHSERRQSYQENSFDLAKPQKSWGATRGLRTTPKNSYCKNTMTRASLVVHNEE